MGSKRNSGICRLAACVLVVCLVSAVVRPAASIVVTSAELLNFDPKTYIDIEYLDRKGGAGEVVLLEGAREIKGRKNGNDTLYIVGHGNSSEFNGLPIEKLIEALNNKKLKEAIRRGSIRNIYLLYCCGAEPSTSGRSAIDLLHGEYGVPVTGFPGRQALCRPNNQAKVVKLERAVNWVPKMSPKVRKQIADSISGDWIFFKKNVSCDSTTTSADIYKNAKKTYKQYEEQYLRLINLNEIDPNRPPKTKKK